MKKLIPVAFLAIFILGYGAWGNTFDEEKRMHSDSKFLKQAATPSSQVVTEISVPILESAKNLNETIKSTPTPVLKNEGEGSEKLDNERIDPYSIYGIGFFGGDLIIDFTEGGPKKPLEISFVSPKNLGYFQNTSQASRTQENLGIIVAEKYQNLLLTIHSGYYAGKSLAGEPLRFYFERWGMNDKEVEQNLKSIEGSIGTITVNGESLNFVVVGAIRVEASDLNLKIDGEKDGPTNILDIPETTKILGNTGILDAKENSHNKLFINFCGWGPKDLPDHKRYTFFRYIVLIDLYENEGETQTLG